MKRLIGNSLTALLLGSFVVSCSDNGPTPLDPGMAPPDQYQPAFDNLPGGTATVCMEQVMENIPGSPDFANCTANDLNLFFTLPGEGSSFPLCLPGDPISDIEVEAHFGAGAANRWDIGLWIREGVADIGAGESATDALRGDCRHWSLVPVGAQGNTDVVDVGGVDTRFAPFYNEDGDSCGDLKQDFETVLTGVILTNLICQDTDQNGFLDVGACVGYDNNGNQDVTCDDPNTAVLSTSPNTPSKCSCGPLNVPVNIGGKVIIQKVVVGPNLGDQQFSFDGDDDGNLLDGTIGDGEMYEAILMEGTYNVTEIVPAGWELTSIQCTDPSGGTSTNVNTATASIDLDAGETVTCTFTNRELGTIIVEKQTDPDGSGQSFSFTGDASGSITDGNQIVVSNLSPGQYTSAETVPAGWDLTSIVCSDANSSGDTETATATFNVEAGETVTCVFTNTELGTIIVEKQTLPDGSAQAFDFTGDASGSITDGNQITVADLLPGQYSSTETVPSGWSLTSIVCDDANSSGDTNTATATFNVEAGETVKCTFTNTEGATIIVEKQTDPDGSSQSFDFTGDASGSITDGNQITVSNLLPGQYSSTETVPSGWELTSIVCDDANSTGDTNTATATFNVEAGETVKCTFTNTELGKIIVEKQTLPDGSGQSFSFTGDASGSITDGGTIMVDDLSPGQYSSTETVPAGWDLTSIVCDDANSSGSGATATFNVEAGETVTCVFTNTERGTIIVEKQTDPDGSTQSFGFTGDASGSITDGNQITVPNLVPGQYSSAETVPAGWELTSIVCDDANSSGVTETATATFNVEPGETVKCTFNNTELGTIIVEKQTVPDGSAQSFAFTGDASGSITDGNQITVANLSPGQYSSTETDLVGWDLTSIVCDDANSSGSGATATFNVEAGETVTCVFTNTQRAMVTLNKTQSGAVPPAGAFSFQIRSGASVAASGTVIATGTNDASGVVEFSCNGSLPSLCENDAGIAKLVPGTYAVCEVEMLPGWANNIDGYTPDSEIPEGSDNGNECIDVTLEAGQMGNPAPVPDPIDNTPPPGGDARTIGYWKNHSCMAPGNQEDVLSDNLPIQLTDSWLINDCGTVVYLLDKRDLSNQHRKRASDAAYNLAAQLAAALLNQNAQAGTCSAMLDAVAEAKTLLASIGFDGEGQFLRPRDAEYNRANELAAILDAYNNNELCPAT